MKNFKIQVNTKNESRKTQGLFFALNDNLRWFGKKPGEISESFKVPCTIFYAPNSEFPNLMGLSYDTSSVEEVCQEITMKDLEDIVKRHRLNKYRRSVYKTTLK